MESIFPIIQAEEIEEIIELPLAKEVAWDFKHGKPIWKNGNPVIVTGKEAVKVWIWKAIMTARAKYPLYSFDFGCDIYDLIGKNFTPELKTSEGIRYIKEALETNPYITEITQINVTFEDSILKIQASIDTVYGEVHMNEQQHNAL